MQTIYKYPLTIEDRQTLSLPQLLNNLPARKQILRVGEQNGAPMLWAMVDTALPAREVSIRMFGTGQPCDASPETYIGTVIFCNGQLVLHLFCD